MVRQVVLTAARLLDEPATRVQLDSGTRVAFISGSPAVRIPLLPSGDGPHHVPRGRRHRHGSGLRFHQRIPRHGERDGHVHSDRSLAGPAVWVIASAGLAIGLGTCLGGRRIIRTKGKGLTGIRSPQGFAAEVASTTVILTSAHAGFALSTTQVCSGGILGAGPGRNWPRCAGEPRAAWRWPGWSHCRPPRWSAERRRAR